MTETYKVHVICSNFNTCINHFDILVNENDIANGIKICNRVIHIQEADMDIRHYARIMAEGMFRVLDSNISLLDTKYRNQSGIVLSGSVFDVNDCFVYSPSDILEAKLLSASEPTLHWAPSPHVKSNTSVVSLLHPQFMYKIASRKTLHETIMRNITLFTMNNNTKIIKSVYTNKSVTVSNTNGLSFLRGGGRNEEETLLLGFLGLAKKD